MKYYIGDGATVEITSAVEPEVNMPPEVKLILPVQTHSANVAIACCADQNFADTDALISMNRSIAVGVRTADCQPILLYAPDIRAVAAVHAGWRGTLARIGGKTVERLTTLGANPAAIKALLGPAICSNCYEVSPELVEQFRANGFRHLPRPDHLDLTMLNTETLIDMGLAARNITSTGHCTRHSLCPDGKGFLFPSWRREPGTGIRLISTICLS